MISSRMKTLNVAGIKLRAKADSTVGQLIQYLQNKPNKNQDSALEVLMVRYLPFALSPDHEQYRDVAIECANQCEAWARAIREKAGLVNNSVISEANFYPLAVNNTDNFVQSTIQSSLANNQSDNNQFNKNQLNISEFTAQLEKIVSEAGDPGVAYSRLVNLQPESEEEWSEEQWEIWNRITDEQADLEDRAMLGDFYRRVVN
jgi:hypothetical protein